MARTTTARRLMQQAGTPVHFQLESGAIACGKQVVLGRKTSTPEQVTCDRCLRSETFPKNDGAPR